MTKNRHHESKRLRKSVKNRRLYVDNLRRSAQELRSNIGSFEREADLAFAIQLDALADRELATAKDEGRRAKEIEDAKAPPPWQADPRQAERAAKAMASMAGRFAGDRVDHLVATTGADCAGLDLNGRMTAVEKRLGILDRTQPEGGTRMLMGARIALAETTAFGAPRF